jgi:hypothetical protein
MFEVGLSFEPGAVNVAAVVAGNRIPICHTLRETGCTGDGWYWTYDHQLALCDATCANVTAAGTGVQIVLETGCSTDSCGGGACTQSSGYCTHATAYTCCSGRCDGDSCGSGLWGPCSGMFGCFSGQCQNGYCQCAPGELQCGARCFEPMDDEQHCGSCDNTCTGGKLCNQGNCECPQGTTECNGTCVSLATDEQHCGMCNDPCRADMVCSGSCVCPGMLMDCNGACIDTRMDPNNCGACNNVCDPGSEVCTPLLSGGAYCACAPGLFDCGNNGTCEDRMTDENNCGTCGRVCPGNKQCIMGDC